MSRTHKPHKGKREEGDEDDFFSELLNEPEPPPPAKPDKNGWPGNVPILVADDIVWQYSDSHGRHDLFYWLELTFNPEFPLKDTKAFRVAYKTLCEVITDRFKKKVTCMYLFLEFTHKHKLPSKAWQAACWNEMLSRLGYEVPRSKTKDPGFGKKE